MTIVCFYFYSLYFTDIQDSTIQRKILFFIWSLLLQDIGVELVIDSIKLNQLQKELVHTIQRKEIQENAFEEVVYIFFYFFLLF